MSDTHARLSPSGADGWVNCAQWANDGGSNTYARYGNACHELSARVLRGNTTAHDHLGELIEVVDGEVRETFTVDAEMIEIVDCYTKLVRDLAPNHALLVETAVPIDHITGEEDAEGTADAILLPHDGEEVVVVDLKTGRGVEVDAEGNLQGLHYGSGALRIARMAGHEPKRVRIIISQPRISRAPSEWSVSLKELEAFEQRAREAAQRHGTVPPTPGTKQCRWCAKKASCQALANRVQADVGAQFEDLTASGKVGDEKVAELVAKADIARALSAVELIEDFCAAIRTEAERRLHNGVEVPGFKLVQGKKGNRAWTKAEDVEALLKSFRLKQEQMFDFKLISPAAAEKLLKDQPKRWARVLPLISQSDGKPTVAPASDKRPALNVKPVADHFHDETGADLA